MAKKKHSQPKKTSKSASEPPKVREAIQKLRAYYQLGCDVRDADTNNPDRKAYSKGVSLRFAEELGVSRDFIDKARQFASSYTLKELEDLCRLRRPDGMPMGTSLIVPLLKLKDKKVRRRFQRRAAQEGWTKVRLEQELALIPSDRPSSGGRRPAKAATMEEALREIALRSERWSRWARRLAQEDEGDDEVSLADLPKSVRDRMESVCQEMTKLGKAAQRQLEPKTRKKK